MPTTQSTADALLAITDPLPAAISAGVSSVGTDAVAAVKDVSRIPVLQPPPVPAAPAVVQKAPAIVEKAPELDSTAGAQLAQLMDTKRQPGEGQAAADKTNDDAGYWLFSLACPKLSTSHSQRVQEGRYILAQGCLSISTNLAAVCREATEVVHPQTLSAAFACSIA